MRYECLPKEIQLENDRLASLFFNNEKADDLAAFIEQFASDTYKKFFIEQEKRRKELLKQGIIED